MHVETIDYKGHEISIWQDEAFDMNPRDNCDVLSRLYSVSDASHFDSNGQGEFIPERRGYNSREIDILERYVSIFLGGVSTTFHTSGNGWYVAYFDRDVIQREWKGDKEAALAYLEAESKEFRQWAEGEVYGYSVDTAHDYGFWDAAVGGFYGHDFEQSGLLEMARSVVDDIVAEEEALQSEVDEMRLIEIGA